MKIGLLFGSSGLIGNNLLDNLISDKNYKKIKLFVRHNITINHPKIEIIYTDFKNLEKHKSDITGDDCFFCIGTTIKNTPDKNEYRRVEHTIPIEIAKIAKSNYVKSFMYVSSGFANPKSSGFYLKNKGEVEEELKNLKFKNLGLLRPSFLLGNRKEQRIGEKIGIQIFKLLTPFFLGSLKKMRPIKASDVAKAMIVLANSSFKKTIYESNEIVDLLN
tara:strand:+ start:1214 stop:1867 length:654 start_codon:yes stop_codon:yes gene_type:complete